MVRALGGALPGELARRAGRKLGEAHRRAEVADPRRGLGGRRGGCALGARAGPRRGRLADRRLRRGACRLVLGKTGRQPSSPRSSGPRTRMRSRLRSRKPLRASPPGTQSLRGRLRRGARVLRVPRSVPRRHPGRRHGHRARGARRAPWRGDPAGFGPSALGLFDVDREDGVRLEGNARSRRASRPGRSCRAASSAPSRSPSPRRCRCTRRPSSARRWSGGRRR